MTVPAVYLERSNKPAALERKVVVDSRRATFVAQPLERGFGLTLGNSLRRVLLSSLQGAAVTSVRIEGVLHEFSSLKGVKEDITDLLLNLKQIAIRMDDNAPRRLTLSAAGPGEVTAGQIARADGVQIMNPTLVLCHLEPGATLKMELNVEVGKGYVAAAANRPHDAPIGQIPVDALFSPVRQVSCKIENSRVGQELDYDKLTIMIETDGTVSPDDALAYAARILQDQLQLFIHFDDGFAGPQPSQYLDTDSVEPDADSNAFDRYLLMKVDELGISVRSARGLHFHNIAHVGDLVQMTEAELSQTPNLGRKGLGEIKTALEALGLRLGMNLPQWRSQGELPVPGEGTGGPEAAAWEQDGDTATLTRRRTVDRVDAEAVIEQAAHVFGSRADAEQWMHRPVSALGNRTPRQFLNQPGGVLLLNEYLNRIDYGVYV